MVKNKTAIFEVIRAFDAFKEAYDVFVSSVESAVPEEVHDEELWDRVSSLVLGSEEVAIYLRDYGYTVDRLRTTAQR